MKREKAIALFIVSIFCTVPLRAAFIEGTDTTDINGRGLGSLFTISNGAISGNVIAHYNFNPDWCSGYYNYAFEDVCLAPDTVWTDYGTDRQPFYCFVIKNPNNSTYSKVQVLKHLNGNKYTYRYLTNTTPNDRILIAPKTNLDLLRLKKVNNLHFTGFRYFLNPGTDKSHTSKLSWDPPAITFTNPAYASVPINYLFYKSANGVTIDTLTSINRSQWVPIALSSSPQEGFSEFPHTGYFNMVSIINRDTSTFLDGWTLCKYDIIEARQRTPFPHRFPGLIAVERTDAGWKISLARTDENKGPGVIALFNLMGGRITSVSVTGNTVFIDNRQDKCCPGGYIVKFVLPGGGTGTARLFKSQ